jgi:hypothetical protein
VTTVVFSPSPSANFTFQVPLDGAPYTVVVWWNLYRAGVLVSEEGPTSYSGWYVSVYAQDGTRVTSLPLVGSPSGSPISLVAGLFTSTLVYYDAVSTFEVLP